MKNNKILFFLIILSIFFNQTKIRADEFNFETPEIQILDKGNTIKAMKGGNKKVMKGGFNETVNQAISSGKELGILFALPGLFLSVIFLAIALQVIPFAYMLGAFYDNNIFVGLFMVTLGGLFFYPMMGMGYFIKIAYLLIHIFVMPTAAGNGLKLFKHYGKKYKFVNLEGLVK